MAGSGRIEPVARDPLARYKYCTAFQSGADGVALAVDRGFGLFERSYGFFRGEATQV